MSNTKNKTKETPLSKIADSAIKTGGKYDTILSKINKVAKKRGNSEWSEGTVRAHIHFRENGNKDYLGKREITDSGIQ